MGEGVYISPSFASILYFALHWAFWFNITYEIVEFVSLIIAIVITVKGICFRDGLNREIRWAVSIKYISIFILRM